MLNSWSLSVYTDDDTPGIDAMYTQPSWNFRSAFPALPTAAQPYPLLGAVRVLSDDVALSVLDESRAAPLALEIGGLNLGLSARLESGPSGLAAIADNLGLTLSRFQATVGTMAAARNRHMDRTIGYLIKR